MARLLLNLVDAGLLDPIGAGRQANLHDESQSMLRPVYFCSAAAHLPIAFLQELSVQLLCPGSRHNCNLLSGNLPDQKHIKATILPNNIHRVMSKYLITTQ